ncbi:MAG TPA: TIGR03943 family protein [Jiangellales bacterium]|nr:TIGR03943 family protein [Jiangellales bacterium]
MNNEVQPVVLVLVGAAVLKISLGEAYLRYVKESLQPFLVASGVVLVLLGLLSAWKDLDRGGNSTSSAPVDHAGDGHDRAHGGPGIAWMLLLPVAAIFLVAPPALGADAASRDSGTVAGPRETSFVPLPEGDPVPLSVADYAVRAGWGGADTLQGRRVALDGFVTPAEDGGWYVTRIAMSCCAADGQAVKVKVLGQPAPPADTWVEVTGTYVPPDAQDPRTVPAVIQASGVVETTAPSNPYL